jgi:hypothetical protein
MESFFAPEQIRCQYPLCLSAAQKIHTSCVGFLTVTFCIRRSQRTASQSQTGSPMPTARDVRFQAIGWRLAMTEIRAQSRRRFRSLGSPRKLDNNARRKRLLCAFASLSNR